MTFKLYDVVWKAARKDPGSSSAEAGRFEVKDKRCKKRRAGAEERKQIQSRMKSKKEKEKKLC